MIPRPSNLRVSNGGDGSRGDVIFTSKGFLAFVGHDEKHHPEDFRKTERARPRFPPQPAKGTCPRGKISKRVFPDRLKNTAIYQNLANLFATQTTNAQDWWICRCVWLQSNNTSLEFSAATCPIRQRKENG